MHSTTTTMDNDDGRRDASPSQQISYVTILLLRVETLPHLGEGRWPRLIILL